MNQLGGGQRVDGPLLRHVSQGGLVRGFAREMLHGRTGRGRQFATDRNCAALFDEVFGGLQRSAEILPRLLTGPAFDAGHHEFGPR